MYNQISNCKKSIKMLNYKFTKQILLLLLLLCVACTVSLNQGNSPSSLTAEYLRENPRPRPEFILNVTSGPGLIEFVQAQCVRINQEPLWVEGYYASELYDNTMANLQIEINGRAIPESDIETSVTATAYPVFDDEHNFIGAFGGVVTVCVNTERLESGVHHATISTQTVTGEEHSYEWAFHHSDVPDNKALPTTVILPSD